MSRSAPSDVKAIIDTSLDDATIQLWIDVANSIVNANVGCINSSETILKQIETNLSAHFVSLLNPGGGGQVVTAEKAEQLSTTYASAQNVTESINTTVYGTAANALSGGCLATYDKAKATVEFF